jgi:20S proteasome subunit alpha 7
MAERLAGFVHAYTMYWSVRPFGSAVLIAGKDSDGPFLWMVRECAVAH